MQFRVRFITDCGKSLFGQNKFGEQLCTLYSKVYGLQLQLVGFIMFMENTN